MSLHRKLVLLNKTKCPLHIFKHKYSSKVKIAAGYQPKDVELGKYESWQFPQSRNSSKPKFRMILPPPNVTGNLHLGHALMATLQDVICRQKRQEGFDVEWIPGTDHAGIATQVVVEKKLFKELGVTRHQIGREKFLEEVWKWKREKGGQIIDDLKKLGCSMDWQREYFTMSKPLENAVNTAFIRLFDEGLMKRQESLVNWSCSLESAISDIEVETKEVKGPTSIPVPGYDKNVTFGQIYDISYKVQNSDDIVTVSTTRPETLLGDIAIAVHPDDGRYSRFAGQPVTVWHPFRNEPIPIVFDDSVDKEFGSGAVKITPAHDKDDFELSKRHNLKPVQVITEKGRICEDFEGFSGLPRFEARDKMLNELAALGLLQGTKAHTMNLPICSRSKDIIEYMLRPQWFLTCREMAANALEAVRAGRIEIHPSNFEGEWEKWLTDSRDWCVSRQLWWGHRIPAYLAKTNGQELWVAAMSEEDALRKAEGLLKTTKNEIHISQDQDVLDTWFSSALLPFSVFNWPSQEYKKSYPLDLMETGHDILFFWVARMVMLGQKLAGDVPFKKILLNGIICDAHGRKMSKSLGNVILPEQVIKGASLEALKAEIENSFKSGVLSQEELKKSLTGLQKLFPQGIPECGTDALRFTLCSHNIKTHFINFDIFECHTNRLFFNKIWQATRFTLQAADNLQLDLANFDLENVKFSDMDKWILGKLQSTKEICDDSFEKYNFHLAVAALRTFFYSYLCDTYLETTKAAISSKSPEGKAHCLTLAICLNQGLHLMAPFTPFLSEELLQHIPKAPLNDLSIFLDEKLESDVAGVLDVCQAVRQIKSQNKISKKHDPIVHLFAQSEDAFNLLSRYKEVIKSLVLCRDVVIEKKGISTDGCFSFYSTAGHLCSFGIKTNDKFAVTATASNLNQKKLDKLQTDLEKLLKTISSDGYQKSANEVVKEKHLEKIKQLKIEIGNIEGIAV